MKHGQVVAGDADTSGEVWSIDADASLQEVLESPGCPALLRQTLTGSITWQDRNRRQVGRAIAAPRVAPQWSAALLALGATVTMRGEDGLIEVPVETLLEQRPKGEVSALHVKTARVRWGAAHVARTPADEPIVAAVAGVEFDGGTVRQARLALTGAGPLRLAQAPSQLVGAPLSREGIQAVADAVKQEVAPEGDFLGSEEYRRAMAGVLSRRALEQCLREEDHD